MRLFKKKKTFSNGNNKNSLFGLFRKKGWERALLNTALDKIYQATRCPCEAEGICLHDILPDGERIGTEFCKMKCPATKYWNGFREIVNNGLNKFIYGND